MVEIKGLEKLAPRDFPGHLSASIFTGGCNFRCPYCHNAELVLRPESLSSIPLEEFTGFLEDRRGFLEAVCVTGGEPLLHEDLGDLLARIKDAGLLVKLDTNGSFPERLRGLLDRGLVDAVAMDVKAPPDKYAEVVGVGVDPQAVLDSMAILRNSESRYVFRTTVVPDFVDAREVESVVREMLDKDDPYVLQPFQGGTTLDPGFAERPHCPQELLGQLAEAIRGDIPRITIEGAQP